MEQITCDLTIILDGKRYIISNSLNLSPIILFLIVFLLYFQSIHLRNSRVFISDKSILLSILIVVRQKIYIKALYNLYHKNTKEKIYNAFSRMINPSRFHLIFRLNSSDVHIAITKSRALYEEVAGAPPGSSVVPAIRIKTMSQIKHTGLVKSMYIESNKGVCTILVELNG